MSEILPMAPEILNLVFAIQNHNATVYYVVYNNEMRARKVFRQVCLQQHHRITVFIIVNKLRIGFYVALIVLKNVQVVKFNFFLWPF